MIHDQDRCERVNVSSGTGSDGSSSSGTMGPAPVSVHCLSCNEFPFSAILGQTVQLL